MDEVAKYLRALVHLQLELVYSPESPHKKEIILARAGFTHAEIASFVGKNAAAVSKAISRAK
jgi:DNA-directed RNA polymerase specialized sigma24 family protein